MCLKKKPDITLIDNIENKNLFISGKAYEYEIKVSDLDKPHSVYRKKIRDDFFKCLGTIPDCYYTASFYNPSKYSDDAVQVTYIVGFPGLLRDVDGKKMSKFSIYIKQAMEFTSDSYFLNPYDAILYTNSTILKQFNVGWYCCWDLEMFRIQSGGGIIHNYIIPVRSVITQDVIETWQQ